MIDDYLILNLIAYKGDNPPWKSPIIVLPKDSDWGYYQQILKIAAYINQDGKCICNKPLDNTSELHHALITRANVRMHPQDYLIHHPYNVLLLHSNCHINITRQKSWELLSRIYGFNQTKNWYIDTPFYPALGEPEYYVEETNT